MINYEIFPNYFEPINLSNRFRNQYKPMRFHAQDLFFDNYPTTAAPYFFNDQMDVLRNRYRVNEVGTSFYNNYNQDYNYKVYRNQLPVNQYPIPQPQHQNYVYYGDNGVRLNQYNNAIYDNVTPVQHVTPIHRATPVQKQSVKSVNYGPRIIEIKHEQGLRAEKPTIVYVKSTSQSSKTRSIPAKPLQTSAPPKPKSPVVPEKLVKSTIGRSNKKRKIVKVKVPSKKVQPPPPIKTIDRKTPIPQSMLLEKWLSQNRQNRKMLGLMKPPEPVVQNPKTLIIEWQTPNVRITKKVKNLGIVRANPQEYIEKYGPTLKQYDELPDFIKSLKPPKGIVLAADYKPTYQLEGDVEALNLVDLKRENLEEYRPFLNKYMSVKLKSSMYPSPRLYIYSPVTTILRDRFGSLSENFKGKISVSEIKRILSDLNGRFGKTITSTDANTFLHLLDIKHESFTSFKQFKNMLSKYFHDKK